MLETDLNCGGSCPQCADTKSCSIAADCQSGYVRAAMCVAPTCTDTVKNGTETLRIAAAAAHLQSHAPMELAAQTVRTAGRVCTSGRVGRPLARYHQEWYGTAAGLRRVLYTKCGVVWDARPGRIARRLLLKSSLTCQTPGCTDTVKNGTETDTDCGGSLREMPDTRAAGLAADCLSGVCTSGTCSAPTCSDKVKNGTRRMRTVAEAVQNARTLKACSVAADCLSGVCTSGTCSAPTCSDNVNNGARPERIVAVRAAASVGSRSCTSATDCISGVCASQVCQVATCSMRPTKPSTDMDCGGVCAPTKRCADARIAAWLRIAPVVLCSNNVCQACPARGVVGVDNQADNFLRFQFNLKNTNAAAVAVAGYSVQVLVHA